MSSVENWGKAMTQTMRTWTDAKLEKEMAFAGPANDGGPQCKAWNEALSAEYERRTAIKNGLPASYLR